MKRITVFLLSFLVLLISAAPMAAATAKDAAPADVVLYAQDALLDKVVGLIEAGFTSTESDTHRYRNAKPGDTYHLSAGKRLYALTGDIDLTEGAKAKIADLVSPTEGWLFTVDNDAGQPVAMIEVSRAADGSFGYTYGSDAYVYDKCVRLLDRLLAADGMEAEPVVITENTLALYITDADGTERIMPAPFLENEAEAVLSVTSLAQLPTGEDLFKALQSRKRQADSSSAVLYGGSVFQDLAVHPDADGAQAGKVLPLRWTVLTVACAAAVVAVAAICILHRRRKTRACSGHGIKD